MNALPILMKTLRDQRVPAVLAGIVLALIALMDVLIYPQYRDGLADFQIPEAMKGLLGEAGSITSPEGFLTAEFFSMMPLVLITIAIIAGTGALAGEEGSGTLELLAALPVKRHRLLLEKAGGIALALILATAISWMGFVVAKRFSSGLPISELRIAEALIAELPLTSLYLALAMAAASLLPNRAASAMLCVGLVIADFFVNTLSSAVKSIEDLRWISPIYWSDSSHVLLHGFDPLRAGTMLALALTLLAVALIAFEHRDLTGGGRTIGRPSLLRLRRHIRPADAPPQAGAATL